LQDGRDEGVLYAGLVARVENEEDLYEGLPQLLDQQQQQDTTAATATAAGSAAWMQLVRCWQPPFSSLAGSGSSNGGLADGADAGGAGDHDVQQAASGGGCGIRLVCREGSSPQQLLQEVETSMHKTASRLVAAARVAA
jgi:hypothetical protein